MIDRSVELEQLYDRVMMRESLAICGPDGMGKRSLLRQLNHKLHGRRVCFRLSLQGLAQREVLMKHLLEAIEDEAREITNLRYQIGRISNENPLPVRADAREWKDWLSRLMVGLQNVSLDFLFVLENLHEYEGSTELSTLLAPLVQSRNSQLLITAESFPEAWDELLQSWEMPPLTTEHLNADIPGDAARELLQYTQGNTAFFAELAAAGATSSNKGMKASIREVMQRHHARLYGFRLRFTDLQWRLLVAIAREGVVEKPHSFDFLVQHQLGAASSVERALRNLADSRMILRTAEGWQLRSVFLQRWIEWLYPLPAMAYSPLAN